MMHYKLQIWNNQSVIFLQLARYGYATEHVQVSSWKIVIDIWNRHMEYYNIFFCLYFSVFVYFSTIILLSFLFQIHPKFICPPEWIRYYELLRAESLVRSWLVKQTNPWQYWRPPQSTSLTHWAQIIPAQFRRRPPKMSVDISFEYFISSSSSSLLPISHKMLLLLRHNPPEDLSLGQSLFLEHVLWESNCLIIWWC